MEEYWIVLPVERRVEIQRRPESGLYREQTVVEGDTLLECGRLPGLHVSLAELFA